MELSGKTRAELAETLAGADREALLDVIFSLLTFEQLKTAAQVARATQCETRVVLADMKAGRFIDPIFGAGFFCRAANSFRVSTWAANEWRRSFFVQVRRDPIPAQKKEAGGNEIGLEAKKVEQRAALELAGAVAEAWGSQRPLMPNQATREATAAVGAESAADSVRSRAPACHQQPEPEPERSRARTGEGGVGDGGAAPIPLTGEGPQKFLTKGAFS